MDQNVHLDWDFIVQLIQLVVVPAIVWLWQHEKRLNGSEKEILRLVTIIEEREKNRLIIREQEAGDIKALRMSMDEMKAEFAKLASTLARMQGHNEIRGEH